MRRVAVHAVKCRRL